LDGNSSSLRIENDASHGTPRSSHDSDRRSQTSKDLTAGEIKIEQAANDALPDQTSESLEPRISIDAVESEADDTAETTEIQNPELEELRNEHKAAEARWQEETHDYIEKIDAVQSKLKYLAKEAADSAREAASAAIPGSTEKQLSEKDERIALLLEEGQKLAKTEMENRAIIKKLRQQIVDNNKQESDTKRRITKLERDLANAESRSKRAEASEKRAQELLNSQSKASRELEIVTSERQTLTATVDELKGQLERAVARAEAAESKAQAEALEKSNRRVADLEGDLSSAKIEKELSEEKLKREIRSLKDNLEREKESARVLEAELKGEQSVLESKMESLRSRAEEVSSSAAGDAQAKLLRQIETLQTQYAVASENWQGIESSLLSRLTGVEKERDEIARKEADLRRKAREVVSSLSMYRNDQTNDLFN
jgi:DNA repair exonuclease SbcCD ATPase subunit